MKPTVPRFVRGLLAASFAFTGVLVACRATLPTDAEIERMDVASATPTARTFTGLIFIDGVRSTESQMKALDRAQIESVEVLKGQLAAQEFGADAAKGVITIKTKRGGSIR